MADFPKRLQNSLGRISKRGGVVLVHHGVMGGGYPLPAPGWWRSRAGYRPQTERCRKARLKQRRSFRRHRAVASCGERMSKFAEDLRARIRIINGMIPNAKQKERLALQKERADLEDKLRRAAT